MVMYEKTFGDYVGVRLISASQGSSVARLDVKDFHTNSLDVVHGGVLTTLADIAMGYVCGSLSAQKVVTVELKMSFMRPVFSGKLVAKGKVLKKGEHLLFASCLIFDEDGQQVVAALGTYMMVQELKK
jgi:acyl-CoA thioesterase